MLTIRKPQADALADASGRPPVLPCDPAWIEVQVLDMDNKPVPGVRYEIRLPDGYKVTGTTDRAGLARYDGIFAGQCEICLPEFDREAWVQL
jgi:hypothetical protein